MKFLHGPNVGVGISASVRLGWFLLLLAYVRQMKSEGRKVRKPQRQTMSWLPVEGFPVTFGYQGSGIGALICPSVLAGSDVKTLVDVVPLPGCLRASRLCLTLHNLNTSWHLV